MSDKKHRETEEDLIPPPPLITPYSSIPEKTWNFYSKGISFAHKRARQFYLFFFLSIILLFIVGIIITFIQNIIK